MTPSDQERQFLERYDPEEFERPSVAVDLVLLSVLAGSLQVLLLRRGDMPDRDKWALPGCFVGIQESLDAAARRVMREKALLAGDVFVEQLYTFGAVERDPRMRIISVAYYALLSPAALRAAVARGSDLTLARVSVPWQGEAGGPAAAQGSGANDGQGRDQILPLAFDHETILGMALQRLRGKLDYSPVGFELLPREFTLRQLQEVHEAILHTPLNKPAFRRRMLDKGFLDPIGRREAGVTYRPAELYRFRRT